MKVIALLALAVMWTSPGLAATDAEQLEALHQKVIDAHRHRDVELLLEDEAPDYVVAGHGKVSRPTIAERRARLGTYLESTVFDEYRDVVPPLVTVSRDGTLGWAVVQVHAHGVQTTQDGHKQTIEFGSAWVELYEKRGGRWYRVGNVSNFED